MPRNRKFEAEHSIANALSVLECVPHNGQQLASLATAIDGYLDGRYEAAAAIAKDVARRCAPGQDHTGASRVASLDDLRRRFIAARVRAHGP